jgi:hypothetical protein
MVIPSRIEDLINSRNLDRFLIPAIFGLVVLLVVRMLALVEIPGIKS